MNQPKHMTHIRFVVLGALILAGALALAQPATPSALLQVTVTDPYGRSVTGLRQESFHVFEDGVEQPVVLFSDADGTAVTDIGVGTIQVDLKNQYLVGFRPSNRVGSAGPHKIEVQVRSIGLPPLQTRVLPVYIAK
jgi:hypothetical protein